MLASRARRRFHGKQKILERICSRRRGRCGRGIRLLVSDAGNIPQAIPDRATGEKPANRPFPRGGFFGLVGFRVPSATGAAHRGCAGRGQALALENAPQWASIRVGGGADPEHSQSGFGVEIRERSQAYRPHQFFSFRTRYRSARRHELRSRRRRTGGRSHGANGWARALPGAGAPRFQGRSGRQGPGNGRRSWRTGAAYAR